ncbi:MAG: extracellular solute-binding protein [Lachnospiraceae bacterium]|jgi:multiple sugar transport system substrate-binding protein|nr:extracellular solute-binding protein [Lachnospiraceae bacterium]
MRLRKTMILLTVFAMLIGSIAGCGKKDNTQTPEGTAGTTAAVTPEGTEGETSEGTNSGEKEWFGTEDGKTITLQFWGGIQPEYGYDEIVENFNREYADKGLQVVYNRYVNDSEGNLQLETYLMAGEDGGVDVFIGYGSKIKLTDRSGSGLLYDYSDYLESIGFDIAAEMGENVATEYVFENGEVWGLPTKFDNNNYVMINKDMFEDAHIEIPYDGWTYAEFYDALGKLTKGEGQDKVYGMCWNFNSSTTAWSTYLGSVLGVNHTFTDDTMTSLNWENQVWIDGLNLVKNSMDAGYAPTLEDNIADTMTVQNLFLEGKCAIYGIFSQMRLAMDTEQYPHDFTTALVPFPVPSEEYADQKTQAWGNYSGDFICVASGTPNKEAACEFVRWYIQGGMNPLIKAARYPVWLGTDMDSILAYLTETAGDTMDVTSFEHLFSTDRSSYTKASYVHKKSSELQTVFWEEAQDFFYGVTPTAEEAMAKAVERGNELLKESAQ